MLHKYLRFSSPEYIHHHLHDSLVHSQYSHQVGMLVEHFIVHDVTEEQNKSVVYLVPL